MKLKGLALLIMTVFLITSCYEMKQDDKGRTVKINKITGEVSVIEGNRIVKLKDENAIKAEHKAAQKLGETKVWSGVTLPIAGGVNATLMTKWSDGNMYYQFFVDKNLRGKGSYYANLTVLLHDESAFMVEKISVPISSMTGVVGGDGETIKSMQYKGQEPMSEDKYRKIREWTVRWAGFDK
jgi:hypothetical protein